MISFSYKKLLSNGKGIETLRSFFFFGILKFENGKKMQGLLARIKEQKNPQLGSKGASRSASIASSIDDQIEDDQQSNNSDESQQTSNTLK